MTFTPESLCAAIRDLLSQNNYTVTGPFEIHGAEVDLKAVSKTDHFAGAIYIEATIEYVDNDKYSKDATKFLLLREKDPGAVLICVSSQGFSKPVQERAAQSRVLTYTYETLFRSFERFDPIMEQTLGKGKIASDLTELELRYEESYFEDSQGKAKAHEFLSQWRVTSAPAHPWIIVLGEYGTGKTALTRILLRRWMLDYRSRPNTPIPFRIELRDFARQFDARGLIHHFLDANGLGHLPIEFVFSLIKQGRIVLLLDGYDEMAQYLHARERRVCLAALADLAQGGAKGILTSRPNYFTEAEEFSLLESLYRSIDISKLKGDDEDIVENEKAIDNLVQSQFLDRYERVLRDLDKTQTRQLVQRALANDPSGQAAVLSILDSVFKNVDQGATISLSGKPVIISYLLEVVEEIKGMVNDPASSSIQYTEWTVYNLILQKLMLRDYRRTPDMSPAKRHEFLQRLAIHLSGSNSGVIDETSFTDLVRKSFTTELNRIPTESREQEIQKLFADLRTSATLTRGSAATQDGYSFSHNSLREFLATEYLVTSLKNRDPKVNRIRIAEAMKSFASSLPSSEQDFLLGVLADLQTSGSDGEIVGMYVSLLWEAGQRFYSKSANPLLDLVSRLFGKAGNFKSVYLRRLSFFSSRGALNLSGATFAGATLQDVNFTGCQLTDADFSNSSLDGIAFRNCDLTNSRFSGSLLSDVDLSDAKIQNADFRNIVLYSGIRTTKGYFEGELAVGYLAYNGALTDQVSAISKFRHHSHHPIIDKIARKLCEQAVRQRIGLTQRGTARLNPVVAEQFLQHLEANGLVETPYGREALVKPTDSGRDILRSFCDGISLHPILQKFLDQSQ